MRISEVAALCGVTPKEVMEQIETAREALTGRGLKLNKKLTPSSSLDQEVAAEMVAVYDRRSQQAKASEDQVEVRRKAEEAERRRVAESRRRQALDEEEKKKAEERRRSADAELARRQQEQARQAALRPAPTPAPAAAPAPAAIAPPAPAAPPVREVAAAPVEERPAVVVAPVVVAELSAAAPAPAPATPVAAAAEAPMTVTPALNPPPPAAPQHVVPPMVRPRPPAPGPPTGTDSRPPRREGDSRPPREGGYQPRDGGAPRPPREGGYPPREGGYQPRDGGAPRPPREGGYPPREGGFRPREGDSRPPREGGYPPREGGYPPRDGAPRPPREGGYPPRTGPGTYPPREGGFRPREGDSRPPREGGYPPREGGYPPRTGADGRPMRPSGPSDRPPYNRDSRGPGGPGGPGGPRRDGGPMGRGGPRPADGRGDSRGGPGRPGGDRPGFGGRPSFGAAGGAGGGASETESTTEQGKQNRRGERRHDKDKGRETTVRDFIEQGMGTDLKDSFGRPRPAGLPGARPAAAPAGARKRPAPTADKRIRPSKLFGAEEESLTRSRTGGGSRGGQRRSSRGGSSYGQSSQDNKPVGPKVIALHGDFTVSEFAVKCGLEPSEIIKKLFLMGEVITMNQVLDPDLAELLAGEFGVTIEVHREGDTFDVEEYLTKDDDPSKLKPRPPVVTVMGHVDHGKTTLLDRIRKANVAEGETGGMTQHIGAYHVETAKGDIVFLDTPGHEAFTAMRARGAQVTDLVILVVAANDGVMPQTVEAINHAKAAGVPIVVAINKIDANGADQMRVKQEMMKHGLLSEEFGGDIIMAPVSALKGTGVDEFLEMVALQAEVLELRANPDLPADGAIVESHIDPARGATATVLVRRGTLRIGDVFLCGTESGRVRAMFNDKGQPVEAATPSMPVSILGLSGSPAAGEQFVTMPDEATAREIADRRSRRRRARGLQAKTHITLENLAEHIAEGELKTLNVIVKADVQGSLEAIRGSLLKIKSTKVGIRVLHAAVGGVGVADVQLADASDAVILGFSVRPDPEAASQAEQLGVDVRLYNIIFNLIADVEKAMLGMLEPVFEEKEEGRALVQLPFKISKLGTVAGSIVQSGAVGRDHHARLVRGGVVVWTGKLASLRRVKDDVKSVSAGVECGIGLERFNDVKAGDIIETYTMTEKTVTLTGEY